MGNHTITLRNRVHDITVYLATLSKPPNDIQVRMNGRLHKIDVYIRSLPLRTDITGDNLLILETCRAAVELHRTLLMGPNEMTLETKPAMTRVRKEIFAEIAMDLLSMVEASSEKSCIAPVNELELSGVMEIVLEVMRRLFEVDRNDGGTLQYLSDIDIEPLQSMDSIIIE